MSTERAGDEMRLDPAICGLEGDVSDHSFEELMEALEATTAKLASAEVGIEAAVELYEQAELLRQAAQERLNQVQERIDRLSGS